MTYKKVDSKQCTPDKMKRRPGYKQPSPIKKYTSPSAKKGK